jgi:hypothetical protein
MQRIDVVLLFRDYIPGRPDQLKIDVCPCYRRMPLGSPGNIQPVGSLMGPEAHDVAASRMLNFNWQSRVSLSEKRAR